MITIPRQDAFDKYLTSSPRLKAGAFRAFLVKRHQTPANSQSTSAPGRKPAVRMITSKKGKAICQLDQ